MAASESATPNRRDQISRRLTALSHFRGRLGGITGDKTLGKFAHYLGAFGSAHAGPASDLVDGPPTAEAQANTGIERTDFYARCLDHEFSEAQVGMTINAAGRKAIA